MTVGADQVLLKLIQLSLADPCFNIAKLEQLLFHLDRAYFQSHFRSLTGLEYQAKAYGPKATGLHPLLDEMRLHGQLQNEEQPQADRASVHPVALTQPGDLPWDVEQLIVSVVNEHRQETAEEMRKLASRLMAWRVHRSHRGPLSLSASLVTVPEQTPALQEFSASARQKLERRRRRFAKEETG